MIKIDKQMCSGCEMCANICPKNCISMEEDELGFRYPKINADLCINCNLCEKYCPVISYKSYKFEPAIYAAQNKNEEERLYSSSGGVFSSLATVILQNNGYVYGARWNGLRVEHCEVSNIDDLHMLRGSKYLQSNIGTIYRQIQKRLNNKEIVLFSGTGCQIAGLNSYLRKEYDNLYMVEVVCHGVPSNIVFDKYVNEIEDSENSKVTEINFRDKVTGWNKYSITNLLENGKKVTSIFNKNSFMLGFIRNMYLRPSCTDCKFKQMKSGSDILLGDFWGVNELGEPWNDDKGTSVMFINTEKGQRLFQLAQDLISFKEVELNFATQFNSCVLRPAESYKNIYGDLVNRTLEEAVDINTEVVKQPSKFIKLKNRLKSKIKRCLGE